MVQGRFKGFAFVEFEDHRDAKVLLLLPMLPPPPVILDFAGCGLRYGQQEIRRSHSQGRFLNTTAHMFQSHHQPNACRAVVNSV
jgi:RNA recognition motif-containing protein